MKKQKPMALCDLHEGHTATVHGNFAEASMRRRLQDLGLICGTRVECVQKSPHGDIAAYLIKDALIAIRTEDARKILVN